ncbi:MAG: FecR family protein [Pseudobacter sp.]|uniref:FecR family protein n=1 Tax=Pseudobacter sp. TaxID=2045420 RepID=UPI003F7FA80B
MKKTSPGASDKQTIKERNEQTGTEEISSTSTRFGKSLKQIRKSIFKRAKTELTVAIIISSIALCYVYLNEKDNNPILTIKVQSGDKSTYELPDGSKVWLAPGSELKFPAKASTLYEVSMQGEAFFEIDNKDRNKHFSVNTEKVSITVLGTSFQVCNQKGTTKVVVMKGAVKVNANKLVEILHTGQQLTVSKEKIKKVQVHIPGDPEDWMNSEFSYNELPLSEILNDLANWYNVKIISNNLSNQSYNLTWQRKRPLIDLLDQLEELKLIRYHSRNKTCAFGDTIVITGN